MSAAAALSFMPLTTDSRPVPGTPFEHALHAFLDDVFIANPVLATQIGYHQLDDRWPDLTEQGRTTRLKNLRRHEEVLRSLPDDQLSAEEHVDRGMLLDQIEAMRFDDEVLRDLAWDPLSYVYLAGTGFFELLGREYAPFAHRGEAFLRRMERLPELFDAARENLVGLDGRPVSLLHTDTALEQLDGVPDLIAQALAAAKDATGAKDAEGAVELAQRLEGAAPAAREAVEAFRRLLEQEVKPRASGDGRLGAELFHHKLRYTLASDLTPERILERAERDYTVIRAEMVRVAGELWPRWMGDEPRPDAAVAASADAAESALVKRVLDAIGQEHPQPDELLEHCRAETDRIQAFVRQRDLIGLPDDPLRITWTPVFMRAYGGAFLSPPGPLDKGRQSYFWITPPGNDWLPERTESYLREDNDRMLRLLCIHEAIPGHFLQLAYANRTPSLTRAIFWSGVFAEGWAVYVTQLMMDAGYCAEDPSLMLIHWKFYLRTVTNAIMDVRIHTAGMTEPEAMDLMVRGGFQEEQEARAKWLRARLTSTQLCTYFVGSLEMWLLEEEGRRRAAIAAGGSASDVPPQQLVGGLGQTPGFDHRAHLESVLAHGSPPVKWVRRILFGGGAAWRPAVVSGRSGAGGLAPRSADAY